MIWFNASLHHNDWITYNSVEIIYHKTTNQFEFLYNKVVFHATLQLQYKNSNYNFVFQRKVLKYNHFSTGFTYLLVGNA